MREGTGVRVRGRESNLNCSLPVHIVPFQKRDWRDFRIVGGGCRGGVTSVVVAGGTG